MSVDLSSLGQIKFKGASNNTLTLSAPDVPANENLTLGNVRVAPVVAVATTITAGQSGAIIPVSCSGAANANIDLPPATVGLNYRFVCSAIAGGKDMTIRRDPGAGTDTFDGYLIGAGTLIACVNGVSIMFDASESAIGNSVELTCYTAGKWAVRGFGQKAACFVVA
jgi:hypothetical protein